MWKDVKSHIDNKLSFNDWEYVNSTLIFKLILISFLNNVNNNRKILNDT